jgi:hypothetical protein
MPSREHGSRQKALDLIRNSTKLSGSPVVLHSKKVN